LNASIVEWDFVKIDNRNYHIIRNNKSYHVELIIIKRKQKKLELKINGRVYSVEVKDKLDLLLEKLGINGSSRSIVKQVKAPMPGLILSINAVEGDKVKMGDAILVLEAMKMENIIKSPGDGVIKKIDISEGDSVEKNQVLFQF
jgi:biotin carboxyl carrier protein